MFTPKTIARCKTRGCWSVALIHTESGRTYWLDVSWDEEYNDINVEWNQYIFYLADPDDIDRKEFQENCDNFDEACSEAISLLEKANEVYQDEDAEWHIHDIWKGEDVWNVAALDFAKQKVIEAAGIPANLLNLADSVQNG